MLTYLRSSLNSRVGAAHLVHVAAHLILCFVVTLHHTTEGEDYYFETTFLVVRSLISLAWTVNFVVSTLKLFNDTMNINHFKVVDRARRVLKLFDRITLVGVVVIADKGSTYGCAVALITAAVSLDMMNRTKKRNPVEAKEVVFSVLCVIVVACRGVLPDKVLNHGTEGRLSTAADVTIGVSSIVILVVMATTAHSDDDDRNSTNNNNITNNNTTLVEESSFSSSCMSPTAQNLRAVTPSHRSIRSNNSSAIVTFAENPLDVAQQHQQPTYSSSMSVTATATASGSSASNLSGSGRSQQLVELAFPADQRHTLSPSPSTPPNALRWTLPSRIITASINASNSRSAPNERASADFIVSEKWRQGALLGRGAFGTVHTALNDDRGTLMAVKTMTFDTADSGLNGKLASLQSEISILKKLDHSHIVKYYSTSRTGTSVNIFMEYVPGGSIKDIITNFGALSDATVVQYTYQIVLGLEYLHRNQVLHGDIKGANILVGVDGTCKLADFGSATVSIERVMAAKQTGTPLWMAPEVVRGEYLIGWASDIWALGCTVMEMLTGKPPWHHLGDGFAVLSRIADEQKPLPLPTETTDLSPLAIRFLRDCLVREPTSRWSAEQLLTHPFFGETVPSAAGAGCSMRSTVLGADDIGNLLAKSSSGLMQPFSGNTFLCNRSFRSITSASSSAGGGRGPPMAATSQYVNNTRSMGNISVCDASTIITFLKKNERQKFSGSVSVGGGNNEVPDDVLSSMNVLNEREEDDDRSGDNESSSKLSSSRTLTSQVSIDLEDNNQTTTTQ
eukprot:PhM_4_TR19128/c1_g1_i1/m.24016